MTDGGNADGGGSGAPAAGTPTWVWWALGAGGVVLVILVFAIAARSRDEGETAVLPTTSSTVAETTTTVAETTTTETTTTTAPPETTTTVVETTTTVAETTTTTAPPETTTTAPGGNVVSPTDITALLGIPDDNVYGNGADLFEPGSVEANWYQWNGVYVVLYRGYDATSGNPICPGNSALGSGGFSEISNSPVPADDTTVCTGATAPPSGGGARVCGDLLYYVTAIQVERNEPVTLFGTVERYNPDLSPPYDGQTSQADSDAANTPFFEPDLTQYTLPASNVDDPHDVSC